ncbi:MAG: HAD family phosphatase [Candidatus Bathyarchaeota archaeon]
MNPFKLVVFDVDGTLLKSFSWQHLHETLGTWSQGKKYFGQFFNGDITYEEWARLDAALWRDQPIEKIQQIVNAMPYTDGAREVLTALRKKGFKIILLSAGLTLVTERIRREIGVDVALANELIVEKGLLTGEVKVNVSFNNKDEALQPLLKRFSAQIDDCFAVGDDETLIPLFERVRLAIAFNPRSENVERHADIVVRGNDLRDVLPYILNKQHLS